MRQLIIFLFLMTIISITQAQTDTQNESWEMVERCVDEPTAPPDDWSFEGYIAFYNQDGIHAIRPELETPYFLAYTNPSQFTEYARFSPDGRWLAIPSGYRTRANWVDYHYFIEEIRIFSTGLDRQLVHRIPYDGVIQFASSLFLPSNIQDWESNDGFLFSTGNRHRQHGLVRVSVTAESYEVVEIDEVDEAPDEVIEPMIYPEEFLRILDVFPHPDGRYFAFIATRNSEAEDVEYSIYIADIERHQIKDLCVSWNQSSDMFFSVIGWSPDGTQLLLDSYFRIRSPNIETLQIIDLEDNQHYQVPYYFSGYVIGWYP